MHTSYCLGDFLICNWGIGLFKKVRKPNVHFPGNRSQESIALLVFILRQRLQQF
jgi:hypothetical protein